MVLEIHEGNETCAGLGVEEIKSRNPFDSGQVNRRSCSACDDSLLLRCPEHDEINGVIESLSQYLLTVSGMELFRESFTGSPTGMNPFCDLKCLLRRGEIGGAIFVETFPWQKDFFLAA